MLQKLDVEDNFQPFEADSSHLLRPSFYWELVKRRWVAFLVPFVLLAPIGILAALLWPPTYLSEGRILVQSQQIPTELVRPTVTSAAQERIQVIEQRTMTRDNLVAIADKFQLFPDKRPLMSITELVALMKKQTKIAPVELTLDFKQRSRSDSPTIVFSVGFEYDDPAVAARVANELMTRILTEDLRDRTSRATDTTKFLAREVQKLQAENSSVDARIAQLRLVQGKPSTAGGPDQSASMLGQLKAELAQKSAIYSDHHPILQTLKKQIESMEKAAGARPVAVNADLNSPTANIDELVSRQDSLQKDLETASAKLAAAQLGENLEKAQQSEKLEIIEQPTAPQDPIKPNRPKVAALGVVLALAVSAGFALLREISDKGIRRSSDIFTLIDSQMVVSIPYIVTAGEQRRGKRRIVFLILGCILVLIGALAAAYLLLPPLDLMIAKARVGLFR